MRQSIVIFVFLTIAASAIAGAAYALVLPDERKGMPLLWMGKAVPPACFDFLLPIEGKGAKKADLKTCGLDRNGKPYPLEKDDRNRVRTFFPAPEEENAGYTAYEVHGKIGEDYVVTVLTNGGGSGTFSSVAVVSFSGDQMLLKKAYTGGDRCNGGISGVKIEGGKIYVRNYITPGDFTTAAYGDDRGIKPYEDLEASATSCFAEAESIDGKVVRVILNASAAATVGKVSSDDEWTNSYPYQACFNKLFVDQAATKPSLQIEEFRRFMDQFMKTCTKSGK